MLARGINEKKLLKITYFTIVFHNNIQFNGIYMGVE
jgi:hypothetical protein